MSGAAPPLDRAARILLVDDHPVVRLGLSQLLSAESDLTVCAEAESVVEALEQIEATSPDVAVVDLSLEEQSGLELIKHLEARGSAVRVLVCSMHDESLFAERALKAGAKGYITKEEATERIVEAVRKVIRGEIYLSAEMTQRMLATVAGRDAGDVEPAGVESLSDRELEVLELLGRALTTREVAERLGLSVKTVETHRENIKTKLHLANNNELIRRAVEWTLREA